jgi:hypothetical protein
MPATFQGAATSTLKFENTGFGCSIENELEDPPKIKAGYQKGKYSRSSCERE